MRKARVTATASGIAPRLVYTDDQGRFELRNLPAAAYALTAWKSGYPLSVYAAPHPFDRTPLLTVSPGEVVSGVDLPLPRGVAVGGTVSDPAGAPLSHVPVVVARVVGGSRPSAVLVKSTNTDDRGEYRIGSLPEGAYLVSASVGRTMPQLTQAPDAGVTGPVTVLGTAPPVPVFRSGDAGAGFYADQTSPHPAHAVALSAGEEATAINLVTAPHSISDAMFVDAGTPERTRPDGSAATGGVLVGSVTGSDGTRFDGALVTAMSLPDGTRYTARTTSGGYRISGLPAGRYRLTGAKAGFATRAHGQQAAFQRGEVIPLGPGEVRPVADVILPRTSAISGTLRDEYGDIVEGARVAVLESTFADGRRQLAAVAGARPTLTDDRGRFRIHGLQPGRYWVRAGLGQVELSGPQPEEMPGYMPTLFPGTAAAAEAVGVAVGFEDERSGIDFALASGRTSRISGVITDSRGSPYTGPLWLRPSARSGAAGASVGARLQNGRFEFPNVPPGEYVIAAFQGRRSPVLEGEFAAEYVAVSGNDQDGLAMQTSAGSALNGIVKSEDGGVPNAPIVLALVAADSDMAPAGAIYTSLGRNGAFELTGVSGLRRLQLDGAPEGWRLKAIRRAGLDVTDQVLRLGRPSQSMRDIEVIVTQRHTRVTGYVATASGDTLLDHYTAIAFATDRKRWYPYSRFIRRAVPDERGEFHIEGLPDGDYLVVAVTSVQGEEWQDPVLLEMLAASATRVSLREGQRQRVAVGLAGDSR